MKCPCCNRVIRAKKPKKDETPGEAHKRLTLKTRASINASLRKAMPKDTVYKD
jgi:phage FluMu protein Com